MTGFYETTNPAKPTFDVGLKMIKVNIPSAFQAFTTVQMLAPVAKYAAGQRDHRSAPERRAGQEHDAAVLRAHREAAPSRPRNVALHDFPAMNKMVEVTKLQILNNPTMEALKAAFQIKEGRLVVEPFDVKVGGDHMSVAGSNGIDQSLPVQAGAQGARSMLGGGANQALAGLVSKAGQAGINSTRRRRSRSGFSSAAR